MRRLLLSLALLLVVPGSWPVRVWAQEADAGPVLLRGVPLKQALDEVARHARIDLVYSSALVRGRSSYCSARAAPAADLLRCVLRGTGLDYIRSSTGAYLLVESPERPPQRGDLAGRVFDAETGEPLPYANVLLADAGAGTTTNEEGLFSMAGLVTGPHAVVISYLGYAAATDSVWIVAGASERLRVGLRPVPLMNEPLIVDALAQRLPSRSLGTGEVDSSALRASAGSATTDVLGSAARVPGVASAQPLADLHIQGGASGEHLVLLDGVPVRNPVSLGRYYGAFSPLAMARLTVHKAGFGAEHGSHLAGAVAVEHDVAGPVAPGLAFSLDPISANAKAQGRWARGGRSATGMVAARTSLWGAYQDGGVRDLLQGWSRADPTISALWRSGSQPAALVRQGQEPRLSFSDLHAAARLELSPFRSLYASLYRGANYIATDRVVVTETPGSDPDRLSVTRTDYDWLNWAGQARYTWLLGSRSVATFHLRGSRHASSYIYHYHREEADAYAATVDDLLQQFLPQIEVDRGSAEYHALDEVTLLAELGHSFTPRRHLDLGLSLGRTASDFELSNTFIAPFMHGAEAWDVAAYAQGRVGLGAATVAEPSVRITWLSPRRAVYAEPRLALRHDRGWRAGGQAAFRVAAGAYRQFIGQFELSSASAASVVPSVLFWLPAAADIAPPRAFHLAAEAVLAPGPRWALDVEGYAKHQPRLLTLDYARLGTAHGAVRGGPTPAPVALPQSAFIAAARGRAYGGSVRLRHTGPRLTAALSYGLSHAVRTYPGRFDERLVPAPWNTPHRIGFDARLALGAGFAADAGALSSWGQRWALRQAYYDYLPFDATAPGVQPYDLTAPERHRLPAYHRLDLGLAYEHAWALGRVHVRAAVLNVLGRRNVYDQSLQQPSNGARPIDRRLPGRHAALTVRVQR